jgi:hypothetical protein
MTVVCAWFTRVLINIHDWLAATAEATEPLLAFPLMSLYFQYRLSLSFVVVSCISCARSCSDSCGASYFGIRLNLNGRVIEDVYEHMTQVGY